MDTQGLGSGHMVKVEWARLADWMWKEWEKCDAEWFLQGFKIQITAFMPAEKWFPESREEARFMQEKEGMEKKNAFHFNLFNLWVEMTRGYVEIQG